MGADCGQGVGHGLPSRTFFGGKSGRHQPRLLERALTFTHIFGRTQEAEIRKLALSLGERVASVASRVRGYLVMSAHLIPPRRANDPSPGPRRLVKAPVAVHPLPLEEGKDPIPSLSPRERGRRQRWDRRVQPKIWVMISPQGGEGWRLHKARKIPAQM